MTEIILSPGITFVLIVALLLLWGIFRRSNNHAQGAWFTRRCPHCRQKIDATADVCACCHRDVVPTMGRAKR